MGLVLGLLVLVAFYDLFKEKVEISLDYQDMKNQLNTGKSRALKEISILA